MHALEHLISGRPQEKIFWIICLMGAIIGAVHLSFNLFHSYMKHEVNTKVSVMSKKGIQHPAPDIKHYEALTKIHITLYFSRTSLQ